MDEIIYVDLVSNASMGVHPENTVASFTNILANPLEFNQPYEVALSEAIYPLEYTQEIPISFRLVLYATKERTIGPRLTFQYKSTDKFTDILSSFTSFIQTELANWIRIVNPVTVTHEPKFEYDESKKRVVITAGELFDGKLVRFLFPDNSFEESLGFEMSDLNKFYETAMGGNKFLAKYEQFLTYRSNLVFINTDIIHGHRVGDSMAMNLRTIPLSKGQYEHVQYMSFSNEYYFPVRLSRIDRISMRITDENGENIRFRGGRVFITLKFRPKSI